jgi:D-alanyl-D-alanine carboxypeptidase
MKNCLLLLIVFLLGGTLFSQTLTPQEKLDSILEGTLVHEGKRPVHNIMLYAKNAGTGFEYWHGAGIVGRSDTPIERDFQFKVASITKTFVATIILQLQEEGKLSVQDQAAKYLADHPWLRFREFHIYEGEPQYDKITLDHLLRHTSGVGDIFTDKETRFVLRALTHKKMSYDEEKVVQLFFRYKLHKHPAHKPGEGFHYSDMNYMLLGFTIEKVTGKTLHENIRERILEPLGMDNTYFEYYEPRRGKQQMIDAYLNRLNVTKKINTSYEWAGGGLVSNVRELGVFIEALFQGRLFDRPESLAQMIDLGPARAFDRDAGMGIFQYPLDHGTFYGHGGYYGSLMLYDPEQQITLVINVGQANAELNPQELMDGIAKTVALTAGDH